MSDVGTGRYAAHAVIVVTHNSAALLPGLLTAIRAACTATSRLVVVDSGSTDGTVEIAQQLAPEADVCTLAGNRGYSAGINAGIAHVRCTGGARAFVVVNPDMRPDHGSLDLLVQALERPGVGIVCGQLRDQLGVRQDSLRNAPTVSAAWAEAFLGGPRAERFGLPVEVLRNGRHYAVPGVVGWATGGLLAFSEACSREVGPWAEELFMYEEEVDFSLRGAVRGYRTWYVPESRAVRLVDEDEVAPWRLALMRRNRVRVVGRGGRVRAVAVAAALVAGDLGRAALGRLEARAGMWAVLRRADPTQIMARYAPHATVSVAQPGDQPSRAVVRQSSWEARVR